METVSRLLKRMFTYKEEKKLKIDAAVFSNVGNIRNNHEDNYLLGHDQYISINQQRAMINSYITSNCVFEGEKGIFAVCDGMGGHAAGEVASSIAVQWLNDAYDDLMVSEREQIQRYVSLMNQDICSYADKHKECKNMGSTLVAIIVANHGIYCVHAGDSRVYGFLDGKIHRLTSDHTEGQRLLDWNLVTEQELNGLEKGKHLYRYLGYPGELVVDVKSLETAEGYYLLCSDGVTDIIEDKVLESIFRENTGSIDIGKKILEQALGMDKKCTDNVTVMVVHINITSVRKKVRF